MLHLTAALDPASQVPLYEQLYRSIAREISAGARGLAQSTADFGKEDEVMRVRLQTRQRPCGADGSR